ncbi:hypothetical protein ACIRQY_29540 [Streptomyces sp. NPDC101490]|uniref:hypothetical protein n=1 Tax=unclassified Streptomyces TaxID=2593676 RepID=UPI0033270563
MISFIDQTSTAGFVSTAKMTDRSVVSSCTLGFSGSALIATGLPVATLPVTGLSGLGVAAARVLRDERPTKAREAAGKATAYDFAATGAGNQQLTQHHTMWAFRGLEPWSDPV